MQDILNYKEMDDETREMLKSFVSEAFDSLDSSEHLIEVLRDSGNPEDINAIFRVFHTLKGLSGFFGMNVINKVTHEAETLLDILRKNPRKASDEIISVIYSTYDFLRDLINRVNNEFSDESAREESQDMIIIIRDVIGKVQNPQVDESFFFDEEVNLPESDSATAADESGSTTADNTVESGQIEGNEFLNQFLEGAYELLEMISDNLVTLEKDPVNSSLISATFGAVHSLKGNAGFMGFAEIEEIAMDMETILDSVRSNELDLSENVISILLSNLEIINDRVSKLAPKSPAKEVKPAALKNRQETPAGEVKTVKLHAESPGSAGGTVTPETLRDEPAREELKGKNDAARFTPSQKKDIRVDTAKIDRLFDLVGELITIESMVTSNTDLKGLELPNFARSANMLNKITRELQEVTMSVRMMPLEGLFNKMKRLVRDVAVKMDKKVDFVISGQETEMDKNVIDEIADPLVHIIRNSIDHGIESPDERKLSGKPDNGRVSLSAKYEGNEILITVKDDGKGLNKEKIVNKAIEKGILPAGSDKISDKEIFKLIFEAGFSTADKVTDISGRGVGMDVVRKNIEKLRGSIDVESVQGQGTAIILRIPLTLAIIESMIFRIGESKFAIPILSVTESLKISPEGISRTMDGLEMVKVRSELLPVVRLHELFRKTPDSYGLEDGLLVITESRDKKVCLFVDEIIGQQQAVVKSLTEYIGKAPGITGCMILGDGGIGLILDIEGIVDMAQRPDYGYLIKNFEKAAV